MDELVCILEEIRDSLATIAANTEDIKDTLAEIRGDGLFNSLSDLYNMVEEAKNAVIGGGAFNSLADVCDKLEQLDSSLSSIDTSIVMLSN